MSGPVNLPYIDRIPINGGIAYSAVQAELIDTAVVFDDGRGDLTLLSETIPAPDLPAPTFEGVIMRYPDVCVAYDSSETGRCDEKPIEVTCRSLIITKEAAS